MAKYICNPVNMDYPITIDTDGKNPRTPTFHNKINDILDDIYGGTFKAKDLAARFVKNFDKYTGNEAGKALVSAGPQL